MSLDIDLTNDNQSSIQKCSFPWRWLLTLSDGTAKSCCLMVGDVGNLSQNSLEEVWNGPQLQKVRADIINGMVPEPCRYASCSFVEDMHTHSIRARRQDLFAVSGITRLMETDAGNHFRIEGPARATFMLRGTTRSIRLTYAYPAIAEPAVFSLGEQSLPLPDWQKKPWQRKNQAWLNHVVALPQQTSAERRTQINIDVPVGSILLIQEVTMPDILTQETAPAAIKPLKLQMHHKEGFYAGDYWTTGHADIWFDTPVAPQYRKLVLRLKGLHPLKFEPEKLGLRVLADNLPLELLTGNIDLFEFRLPPGITTLSKLTVISERWQPSVLMGTSDARMLGVDLESVHLA